MRRAGPGGGQHEADAPGAYGARVDRVVADHLSTLLICPSDTAVRNLATEGITQNVHQVGDVMYDSVLFHAAVAERGSRVLDTLSVTPRNYYLATIHRAENTDDPGRLEAILTALGKLDRRVILPLHPPFS